MANPKGEGLKVGFDGSIRLEFHGAKVTSDAGLLAYRDLDEALALFDSVPSVFHDSRTGRNIQHDRGPGGTPRAYEGDGCKKQSRGGGRRMQSHGAISTGTWSGRRPGCPLSEGRTAR